YKVEKPDALLSPVMPALQHPRTMARATPPRTTTPPLQHPMQQRTECSKKCLKQKLCTKSTLRKLAPPQKEDPQHSDPRTHTQHQYTRQKELREKTHTEAHKRQRAHRANSKTHREAETTLPREQFWPARLPKACRPLLKLQELEPRHGTRIQTRSAQIQKMPIPTQGQPPTLTTEENLHPPQHSNNSQNT
ncbi:hypothetical protein CRENBAI_007322, partial [Crenichthys baileyi]